MSSTNEDLEVGARLKELREREKLSQQAFADSLNVSLRTYQNYERGQRAVSKELLCALINQHDVDVTWLLTGVKGGTPPDSHQDASAPEINEGRFREVWAALRSEDCQLRHLEGDLLLGQAIYIYNQFAHIDDQGSRAKAIRGVVKLLNLVTLKSEAQQLRHFVRQHPEMPKAVVDEFEGLAQRLENQASAEERGLEEATSEEERQSSRLAHSAHQSIFGSGNQVAGRDFQNHGDHKGGRGGKR
ncbi:helix-turn-helix transcriptional regulator [Halomonas campisalis]|uniref:Helix-turn-helix transcriptional regulator n=1 Tax=Billgrantia campisalis TaxID=74661 RepID=A0ABS9PC01_9GAMM|nr:helix-turn-helix transcriptional regulator [Halomonas campisalis]MCG6659293.1 helix-turn-helix transcriptional regulator [Halomonas campisalis]MDR5864292.1 helix-turn-helix transcriptional regulator [Halomonas campisalis]